MEERRESCETAEITVESIAVEGACTVDTKAIETQEEISDGLEFTAEFSHDNVENIASNLGKLKMNYFKDTSRFGDVINSTILLMLTCAFSEM